MPLPRFALAALLAAAPAAAQHATDVGLMMDGGMLTVIYGQSCGPFTCQPFHAGPTGPGQPYNVYVFGAPLRPFVLAADLPSNLPCLQFPGIANSLILVNQPVTLAVGLTGAANPVGTCYQGRGQYVLQFPAGTPPGVDYVLQGLVISHGLGTPAFTVAIQTRTA